MAQHGSSISASTPPLRRRGCDDNNDNDNAHPPITQQPTRNVGSNDNASAPMAGRRVGGRGILVVSILKNVLLITIIL